MRDVNDLIGRASNPQMSSAYPQNSPPFANKLYVSAKEPYIFANELCISAQAPYISANELYICTRAKISENELYISAKNFCISAKEPCISTRVTYVTNTPGTLLARGITA